MLEIPKMQERKSFFLTRKREKLLADLWHSSSTQNISLSKLPRGSERDLISL